MSTIDRRAFIGRTVAAVAGGSACAAGDENGDDESGPDAHRSGDAPGRVEFRPLSITANIQLSPGTRLLIRELGLGL